MDAFFSLGLVVVLPLPLPLPPPPSPSLLSPLQVPVVHFWACVRNHLTPRVYTKEEAFLPSLFFFLMCNEKNP